MSDRSAIADNTGLGGADEGGDGQVESAFHPDPAAADLGRLAGDRLAVQPCAGAASGPLGPTGPTGPGPNGSRLTRRSGSPIRPTCPRRTGRTRRTGRALWKCSAKSAQAYGVGGGDGVRGQLELGLPRPLGLGSKSNPDAAGLATGQRTAAGRGPDEEVTGFSPLKLSPMISRSAAPELVTATSWGGLTVLCD